MAGQEPGDCEYGNFWHVGSNNPGDCEYGNFWHIGGGVVLQKIYTKLAGAWEQIQAVWYKNAGAWVKCKVYTKVAGIWKEL